MIKAFVLPFYLTLLVFLLSCVPEPGARKGVLSSDVKGDTGPSPSSNLGQPSHSNLSLFWFTHRVEEETVPLAPNRPSPFFLKGTLIRDFLSEESSFLGTYCLLFHFPDSSPKTQLRVAAVPTETVSQGGRERSFLLRPGDTRGNTRLCGGSVSGVLGPRAAYHPGDLCRGASCPGGSLPSPSSTLWKSDSGTLNEEVSRINLSTKGAHLHLDGLPQETSSVTCSDSSCKALGLDCCLASENQCVKDGALRPNASSQSGFSTAVSQVSENKALYINWPHIYYVCPQGTVAEGGDSHGDQSTKPGFEDLVKDYRCQEREDGDRHCDPDRKTVLGRIQKVCGCAAGDGSCPDHRYKALKDEQTGRIIDISCVIGTAPSPEIKDMVVSLGAGSVPHRFFKKSDGKPIDEIDPQTLNGVAQEGEAFFYLDPVTKMEAQNGSFNMNSILGSMGQGENLARPAKMVPVEFGKIYIVSTEQGNVIPCPLCPVDSWYEGFSAFPMTQGGNGLVAVGHTGRRDEYEQNATNGNFEDTKFGRACWVPPTMLPFAHKRHDDEVEQRRRRLQTQAALYINGYQRDWFGFNKGAVIGSFDGVSWFAVGSGRRVEAKSNKLFLAVNAPFGDLSVSTNLRVSVREDANTQGQTPDFDFDPSITDPSHAHYNQAASCQKYHQCEVDSDCVTQLGWEYMCADISLWKTEAPSFDLSGLEKGVSSDLSKTVSSFLVGGLAPGSSRKRCVYRGMGALCQRDFESSSISSLLRPRLKKLITCAPNFYCASLSDSVFNEELVREPNSLSGIIFGFESDVLGRPLHYVGARASLPASVQDNMEKNLQTLTRSPLTGIDPGLCMPGKDLTASTYLDQHRGPDPGILPTGQTIRTDYINQIGSCDSDLAVGEQVRACPLFDDEGDYLFTTVVSSPDPKIVSLTDNLSKFRTQNSCGDNSRRSSSTDNTFASIEADVLGLLASLGRPSFSEHACLRRAGSPCFTDLDCTPSRLHAETAAFLGLDSFGGTQGEKDYWLEYLVCAQEKERPIFGTPEFKDYEIKKNRCCRPIGEHLSIVLRKDVISTGGLVDDPSRPRGDLYPFANRNTDRRYSRYLSIYEDIGGGVVIPYKDLDATSACTGGSGCLSGDYEDETADGQWEAPDLVAAKTCCGGGWVRKFADGTHDWTKTDRNVFRVDNFQCLNYRSEYVFEKPPGVSLRNYNEDIDRACREAANGGCPQIDFIRSNGADINGAPLLNDFFEEGAGVTGLSDSVAVPGVLVAKADYSSLNDNLTSSSESAFLGEDLKRLADGVGIFAPSGPRHKPSLANNPNRPWLDADKKEVEYHIPAYINVLNSNAENNLVSIGVSYSPASGASSFDDFNEVMPIWDRSMGMGSTASSTTALTNGTVFKVRVDYDARGNHVLRLTCGSCNAGDFERAWPIIEFIPQGTRDYRRAVGSLTVGQAAGLVPIPPATTGTHALPFVSSLSSYGMTPGSDLYYLTKLGRLELLGIPQIHFEPLYCHSDMGKLVPGLYSRFNTKQEVEDQAGITDYQSIIDKDIERFDGTSSAVSGNKWVAGRDNSNLFVLDGKEVALNPVFSEDELTCCNRLGTVVSSPGRCCTGYAKKAQEGLTCALPSKIDLMVYFNRFISGEGKYDKEREPNGLTKDDFDPKTGEPKINQKTYDKIRALGQKYCDNNEREKTRTGGAFGNFLIEPLPPSGQVLGSSGLGENDPALRRYGIVDSSIDRSIDGQKGYGAFVEGFRWNHHLYCK
ncbi:MAG: hypothetical protein OXB88_06710 [Bacteriovoracales bacterium]|nr:hypothetical protein [Bacteriovoracales bacterium]